MKTIKNLIFLFISLIYTCYSEAQEVTSNEVYTTYWGMKNEKSYPLNTDFTVKFQNNKVLVIENFFNKFSGEKTPITDIYKPSPFQA